MSEDEKWRCLISEILKVGKREHLVEAIYNREGGDKFKISIMAFVPRATMSGKVVLS